MLTDVISTLLYAHAQFRRYLLKFEARAHICTSDTIISLAKKYDVAQKDGAADGCEILRKRGNDSDRDLEYNIQQQRSQGSIHNHQCYGGMTDFRVAESQ